MGSCYQCFTNVLMKLCQLEFKGQNKSKFMTFSRLKLTFAQETAITILAPALAIPLASDLDPTYQIK